jgi:hypothetical protein
MCFFQFSQSLFKLSKAVEIRFTFVFLSHRWREGKDENPTISQKRGLEEKSPKSFAENSEVQKNVLHEFARQSIILMTR